MATVPGRRKERGATYLRLVGLGALIGIPAALLAAVFLALVHDCEDGLCIGVAIASFAVIWFDASPTWAVAAGPAAGMPAGTNFVISALLFSTLIVGRPGLDTI